MKFWKKKGLKVCIVAMAKSGSTALFQAIRTRMSGEVLERFEPQALDEAKDYKREQQVLTKIIHLPATTPAIGRRDSSISTTGLCWSETPEI
jgi:hypothetical protein